MKEPFGKSTSQLGNAQLYSGTWASSNFSTQLDSKGQASPSLVQGPSVSFSSSRSPWPIYTYIYITQLYLGFLPKLGMAPSILIIHFNSVGSHRESTKSINARAPRWRVTFNGFHLLILP